MTCPVSQGQEVGAVGLEQDPCWNDLSPFQRPTCLVSSEMIPFTDYYCCCVCSDGRESGWAEPGRKSCP